MAVANMRENPLKKEWKIERLWASLKAITMKILKWTTTSDAKIPPK